MIAIQIAFNRIFLSFLLLALTALALSFGFEFYNNSLPCYFCILQRIIYLVLFLLAFGGIFMQNKKTILRLIIITFLASFLIASYHFSIQMGLIEDICNVIIPVDINDFKKMMFQPTLPCSKIDWAIGGISISGINATISILCLLFASLKFNKINER